MTHKPQPAKTTGFYSIPVFEQLLGLYQAYSHFLPETRIGAFQSPFICFQTEEGRK